VGLCVFWGIWGHLWCFVVFAGCILRTCGILWNLVEFVGSRVCRGSRDSRGSAYFGEYEGNYGVLGCLQGVSGICVESVRFSGYSRARYSVDSVWSAYFGEYILEMVFWGVYRVYFVDLWNFVEFVDFVMSRRYRGSWDSLGSAYFGEYDGIYGVLGCLQGVFCGFAEVCGISGITEWSACSRICYRCSYWVDLGICLRTALPSPSPAPPPHSQIT